MVGVAGEHVQVCVCVGNRNNTYTTIGAMEPEQTLEEDKSGMFLGGAMASLGDKFIVSW